MLNAFLTQLSRGLRRYSNHVDNFVYRRKLQRQILNEDAVDTVEFLNELCNLNNEPFDVYRSIEYLSWITPDLPDGGYFELFEAILEFARRKSFVGSLIVEKVNKGETG